MNTYIMDALKQIKNVLSSNNVSSSETIDPIIGELEMMKMEIEQHITNMPQSEEYKNIRSSAEITVRKLLEILDLLEDLPYDNELVYEILELVDEISY